MAKLGKLVEDAQKKQREQANAASSKVVDTNLSKLNAVENMQNRGSASAWFTKVEAPKLTQSEYDSEVNRLSQIRQQAAVDLDSATVDSIDKRLKALREQQGLTTFGDRANDVTTAITAGSFGTVANTLGLGANLFNNPEQYQREINRLQTALDTGKTTDGKALNDTQRQALEVSIADLKNKKKQAESKDSLHNKIYSFADRATDDSALAHMNAKQGLGGVGSTIVDSAVAFGQSAVAGAIGGVTGTGMLPFMVQAFGGATQDARRNGATLEQQIAYGGAQAAKEYVSEKIFGLAVPQKLAGVSGSLDDATKKLIQRSVRNVVNKLGVGEAGERVLGGLATWFAGGVTEGAEELIGAWVEDYIINPNLRGYDPDDRTAQEKREDALYNMLVGGISGLMGVTNLLAYTPGTASTSTGKPQIVNATRSVEQATVSPAASPEVQQVQAQAEVTKSQNPEAEVLDAATTLFTQQGMNLKTAQKRAEIVGKLIRGEEVSDKDLNRIEPTSKQTKQIFTQLTGVQFPSTATSIEALRDLYRSAHTVAENARVESDLQRSLANANAMNAKFERNVSLAKQMEQSGYQTSPETQTRIDEENSKLANQVANLDIGPDGKPLASLSTFAEAYRSKIDPNATDKVVREKYAEFRNASRTILFGGHRLTKSQFTQLMRDNGKNLTDKQVNALFNQAILDTLDGKDAFDRYTKKEASNDAREGVSSGDSVRSSGKSEGERSGAVSEGRRGTETENQERGGAGDSARTDGRGTEGDARLSGNDESKTRQEEVKALHGRKPKTRSVKVDGEDINVLQRNELDEGSKRVKAKFAKIGSQVFYTLGDLPVVVRGKKLKGKRAAGIHFKGVTYVQMDNLVSSGEQLGNHEFIHELLMKFPSIREKLQAEFDALPVDTQARIYKGYVQRYAGTLKGKKPEVVYQAIMDEIFCDAYGNINRGGLGATVLHDRIAGIVDPFVDGYAAANNANKQKQISDSKTKKETRDFALSESNEDAYKKLGISGNYKNWKEAYAELSKNEKFQLLTDSDDGMLVFQIFSDGLDVSEPYFMDDFDMFMADLPSLAAEVSNMLGYDDDPGKIDYAKELGLTGNYNTWDDVKNEFDKVPFLTIEKSFLSGNPDKPLYKIKVADETILNYPEKALKNFVSDFDEHVESIYDAVSDAKSEMEDWLAEIDAYTNGWDAGWGAFNSGLKKAGGNAVIKVETVKKNKGESTYVKKAFMLGANGDMVWFGTYDNTHKGFCEFLGDLYERLPIALDNKSILEQESQESDDSPSASEFQYVNDTTGELHKDEDHFYEAAKVLAEIDYGPEMAENLMLDHLPGGNLAAVLYIPDEGTYAVVAEASPNENYQFGEDNFGEDLDDDLDFEGNFEDDPEDGPNLAKSADAHLLDPHHVVDEALQNNRQGFTPTDTEEFSEWFHDDSGWLSLVDDRPKVLARGSTNVGPTVGRKYEDATSGGTFVSDREDVAKDYGSGITNTRQRIGEIIGLNRFKRGDDEIETGYKRSWSAMVSYIMDNYCTQDEKESGLSIVPTKAGEKVSIDSADTFVITTDILPEELREGYDTKESKITSFGHVKVTGERRTLAEYPATNKGLYQLNRDIGRYISDLGLGIKGYYKVYGSAKKTLVIDCHNYSYSNIPNEYLPEFARSPHRPSWDQHSHINGIVRRAFRNGYDCVVALRIDDAGGPQTQYIFKNPEQVKSVYNEGSWNTEDPDRNFALSEEDEFLSERGLRNNYSSWKDAFNSIAHSSGIQHNLAFDMDFPAPFFEVNTVGVVGFDGEWLETLGEYESNAEGLKKFNADIHDLAKRAEDIAEMDVDATDITSKENLGSIDDEDIAINSGLLSSLASFNSILTNARQQNENEITRLDNELQDNREGFTPTDTPEFKRWHKDPKRLLTLPDGRPIVFLIGDALSGYTRGRKYGTTNSPGLWQTLMHGVAYKYANGVTSRLDWTPMDSLGVNKIRGGKVKEIKHEVRKSWEEITSFINSTYQNEDAHGVRLVPVNDDGEATDPKSATHFVLQTNILPSDMWWGLDEQGRLNTDEASDIFDTEVISNSWRGIASYSRDRVGLRKLDRELGDIITKINAGIRAVSKCYISMSNPLVIDCKYNSCHSLPLNILPSWVKGTDGIVSENDFVSQVFEHANGYDGVILKNILDEGGIQDQYVVKNPWQRKSVYNQGTWSSKDYDTRYALSEEEDTVLSSYISKLEKEYGVDFAQSVSEAVSYRELSKKVAEAMSEIEASVGAAPYGFDPYSRMMNEYGTIDPGENPARAFDVPASTNGTDKVSKTVRTVSEAKATPDSRLETIEQATVDGKLSYIPIKNKVEARKAEYKIKALGWADALAEWTAEARQGYVSARLIAEGATLLNNAGNHPECTGVQYTSLLVDYTNMLRVAGQATQAARILKTLSPDATLYTVEKMVQNINDHLPESLRKLLPDGVKVDESLIEEYRNAKTAKELEEIMDRILQNIADQIPSTLMDKFTALRYLNMLGNFKTQVRNVVGNAMFVPVRRTKDTIGAIIEGALVARGKDIERTKSITRDKATYQACVKDYEVVRDIVMGGGKYDDSRKYAREIEDKRRIFKSKFLESYRKATNWAMNNKYFGDEGFSRFAYADAMARYLAANKVTYEQASLDMLDKAREYAIQQAAEATYRDNNAFSTAISQMRFRNPDNWAKKGINTVGEGLLPFRRTPANILVRAIEYNPIGFITTAATNIYGVTKKGETLDATRLVEQLSKNITGTGICMVGYLLYSLGLLRGKEPEEDKLAQYEELLGHQAYSIELPNGVSLTLDWLAPASIPMFLGAQFADAALENGLTFREGLEALGSITDPMLQMSMLQGVNDALENASTYGNDSALVRLTGNSLWSFATQGLTNTLLGQIERSITNDRMTTYVDKNKDVPDALQRLLGKASAKTPAWDYGQIPYIDAWGRVGQNAETAAGNALNQFFNPAYTSRVEESKMEAELRRLYEATGASGVLPSRAKSYFNVDKKRLDLTAEQYVDYATMKGQTSYAILEDLTSDSMYKELPDEIKEKAVVKVMDFANEISKAEVSDYAVDKWVNEAAEDADKYGIPVATYALASAQISVITGIKDDDGETISGSKAVQKALVIRKLGLSDKQTEKLMEDFDVGKDYKNMSEKNLQKKLDKWSK